MNAGPTAEFLRQDKELRSYVDARRAEALGPGRRSRARSRKRIAVEDVLNKLPLEDRYLIRQEFEKGRVWKEELDLAKALMKKIEPLEPQDIFSMNGDGPLKRYHSSADLRHLAELVPLLAKLKDNDFLAEFGLKHTHDRVQMSFSPGRILIAAEELAVLSRLCRR